MNAYPSFSIGANNGTLTINTAPQHIEHHHHAQPLSRKLMVRQVEPVREAEQPQPAAVREAEQPQHAAWAALASVAAAVAKAAVTTYIARR